MVARVQSRLDIGRLIVLFSGLTKEENSKIDAFKYNFGKSTCEKILEDLEVDKNEM